MPQTRMFRDRVVSMEQTLEGGEKNLDFLKGLCREAFPDFEYREHGLDHERDLFVMTLEASDGRKKTVGWTRMVLYDAERLPSLVENPISPLRSRVLAFLQARAARTEILVTFRHLEEGWVDTPEPRKEKRRGRRGGRDGRGGSRDAPGAGREPRGPGRPGTPRGEPGQNRPAAAKAGGGGGRREGGRGGRPPNPPERERGGAPPGPREPRPPMPAAAPVAARGPAPEGGPLEAGDIGGAPAAPGRRRRSRRRRRGRGGAGGVAGPGAGPGSPPAGAPAGPKP